jgi:hypothetical protein
MSSGICSIYFRLRAASTASRLIGYVLERQISIWAFLITYVAVHLAVGWTVGPLPFSAFAGIIAWSVAQGKKRRRSILLPRVAQ